MAWTAIGYRFSAARLSTPGSGLDDQDRYAIGSGVVTGNPAISFSSGDRFHIARLPFPGDGLSFGDRLAIAGGWVAELEAGRVIELFETTVPIGPTWTVNELPQLNTGEIAAAIAPFVSRLVGLHVLPGRVFGVAADDNTANVAAEINTHSVEVEGMTIEVV